LGIPFLRNYYTVFDADNAKIGIAPMLDSTASKVSGVSKPTQTETIPSGTSGSSTTITFTEGLFAFIRVAAVLGTISGVFAGLILLL
jgi:hypothetical protein